MSRGKHGGWQPLLPLRYGIEAPYVPAALASGGLACGLLAYVVRSRWLLLAGGALTAQAGIYLHTTARGKLLVWERELDRLQLHGDEHLLDLGCGRGAVLIAAARRLPAGQAVGIDLWRTQDQSGNAMAAALSNAQEAGVANQIDLHTGDMTALPFPDDTFDVVTSALAVHNIPTWTGRERALDEAIRVLRPGGRLLIADFRYTSDYVRHLGHRASHRKLGPNYWYGGPWAATSVVTMTKSC